ncbi:hypothetical protein AMECASPLE_032324 [Ameca splendens]|uniref:Uncharacterized protein n=1 Tax=Ameca splendens TaxID=208324 RepID=A0ABV0ZFC9_9TELE
MLLAKVMWPVRDIDDEEDCDAESMCHFTGFLRTFIETASSDTLVQLLRFWAGWEVLPSEDFWGNFLNMLGDIEAPSLYKKL